MKRVFLGIAAIVTSIPAIGCDSGGTGSAGDTPAQVAATPAKGPTPKLKNGSVALPNPNGPKNDR